MSDLLQGIQRDIRKRLDELRPLVSEYEQLRQATAALEGVPAEPEPAATKPRAASPPRRKRAPAGTNRERVLAAVRDNPGASASQIAEASGVQRTVVYGVLRRLSSDGVIDKREDPEKGTGYALTTAEQGGESAADASAEGGELASDADAQESDAPD
jgi:DNA-binding MarR family transcriptional regulator